MKIDIISAVPELLSSPLNTSILKRAQDKKKVKIEIHNLRDYAFNKPDDHGQPGNPCQDFRLLHEPAETACLTPFISL